jgi:hypothetical protein
VIGKSPSAATATGSCCLAGSPSRHCERAGSVRGTGPLRLRLRRLTLREESGAHATERQRWQHREGASDGPNADRCTAVATWLGLSPVKNHSGGQVAGRRRGDAGRWASSFPLTRSHTCCRLTSELLPAQHRSPHRSRGSARRVNCRPTAWRNWRRHVVGFVLLGSRRSTR